MQINGSLKMILVLTPLKSLKIKAADPKEHKEKGIELCFFWILSNFSCSLPSQVSHFCLLSEAFIKDGEDGGVHSQWEISQCKQESRGEQVWASLERWW